MQNNTKKIGIFIFSVVYCFIIKTSQVFGEGIYFPDTGLPDPDGGIVAILTNFLDWLLAVIGFIAIISFCISGIIYFTAAGDEDQAKRAKKAMFYSIIGVVVALSGFVIVQAVDAALRGSWFI